MNEHLCELWSNINATPEIAYHTVPDNYLTRADKLLELFKLRNITSFFDAGCGSRSWVDKVDFAQHNITYRGGDISIPVVSYCNSCWPKLDILHHDLTSDPFPAVDVLLSSDVVIHLSTADKLNFLKNFVKSDIRYLLSTNCNYLLTNPTMPTNELHHGFIELPVNWELAPWHFPRPLDRITDNHNELCLWKRSQIEEAIRDLI